MNEWDLLSFQPLLTLWLLNIISSRISVGSCSFFFFFLVCVFQRMKRFLYCLNCVQCIYIYTLREGGRRGGFDHLQHALHGSQQEHIWSLLYGLFQLWPSTFCFLSFRKKKTQMLLADKTVAAARLGTARVHCTKGQHLVYVFKLSRVPFS